MKKLLFLVLPVVLTAGCGYPMQSVQTSYPVARPSYPRAPGPQFNIASSPVGRWDNVMMSAVGTPLLVLTMNGTTATGDLVAATSDAVRLRVASGEVEFAAADVMRVDRLSAGQRAVVRQGVRGAAFGTGVVAVLALIGGHVPPPRLFAAGAIIGAEQNIEYGGLMRGAATIYLARGVIPSGTRARDVSLSPCDPRVPTCYPNVRFSRR
jgi:hypothetical protein